MTVRTRILWGLAVSAILVSTAAADTLVTTDGRQYDGKVLRREGRTIVFQVYRLGGDLTVSFAEGDVTAISQDPVIELQQGLPAQLWTFFAPPVPPPISEYDTPTYYRIPLSGRMGWSVLAPVLEYSLADAVRRRATVVVLEIDSPGGSIHETDAILQVLRRYQDQARIVVYVRRALSAAAVTALAGREIYMDPAAVIGAAKAFHISAKGVAEQMEEKSAAVWRAIVRGSAETGGHSPLLAEAMIGVDLELHLTEEAGVKVVRAGPGPRMICRKGQVLTLTAREAQDVGLTAGTAVDYSDLGRLLHLDGWIECQGIAAPLAEHWAATIERADQEFRRVADDFDRHYRQACQQDPARFTYALGPDGAFTSDARLKWRDRSERCSRLLAKADSAIEDAHRLAKAFPPLGADADAIHKRQLELAQFRDRVMRDATRCGPNL